MDEGWWVLLGMLSLDSIQADTFQLSFADLSRCGKAYDRDAGKESVRANCPAHQQALCAIELHCVSRAFSCRVSPSLSTTTACRSVRWTCDIAKVASSASCQIISSNSKRKGEKEAESSSTDPKANHISDFQWFFIKRYLNKNLMASEIRLL